MKKRIILLMALLMAAAIGLQAQSRLEPMTTSPLHYMCFVVKGKADDCR